MTTILAAFQFLTRIPIKLQRAVPHDRIVVWFPLVGLVVGAAVGGVGAALYELVPPLVAGACAVAFGLLVTGAFHEDGLADVADAFGGGWSREERLEILEDSRHGTYGVAALTTSITIRVVTIGSMPSGAAVFASVVAAHVLARGAILATLLTVRPASESGLGADTARTMRRSTVLVSTVVAGGLAWLAVGWWAAPLIGAAAFGIAAVAWLAIRKIGGIAGDVLGTVEQVVECLALIVASGLATHFAIWWA